MNTLSESALVRIWQRQLLDSTCLVTEEGEPLNVIYPGRVSGDRGADLVDAVIDTGRGLVRGDIEVHVKSSGWRTHGHHLDPAYNGVILHVVYRRDSQAATSLQSGETVPTLALERYICQRHARPPASGCVPCHRGNRDRDRATGLLDSAGEERFLAKATAFENDMAQTEAAQVLYQGLMGALGYAKNKSPCLELARRLPLRTLNTITQGVSAADGLARRQAMLLGTAGLLPSQRYGWYAAAGDSWVDGLERAWASACPTEVMSERDWHLLRVRPHNLPQRRLAAMSYLLQRYRETGILEGLIGQLKMLGVEASAELEKTLMITADGYWSNHFDFGLPSRQPVPSLIGTGRAADIVVNVLLPFALARGRLEREPDLAAKAVELYRGYRRLAANVVETHMRRQLGLDDKLVNSARRQQGLLHIYRTLCSQGKCTHCPLGND